MSYIKAEAAKTPADFERIFQEAIGVIDALAFGYLFLQTVVTKIHITFSAPMM